MPRRAYDGGANAGTTISMSLCTDSSYGGSNSIMITTPVASRQSINASPFSISPVSVHRNYRMIDDFESYPDYTSLSSFWKTSSYAEDISGFSWFAYYLPSVPTSSWDMQSLSILSFVSMANAPIVFNISFVDDNGVSSSDMLSAPLSDFLARQDIIIDWGDCDYSKIRYIKFYPRNYKGADIYMDDVVLLDARTESEKTEWISMNVTSMDYDRDNSVNYTQVAGSFGDSIYSTNPNRRRGKLGFRTRAPEYDDDLLFMENSTKRASQLYFRCLSDGYLIQPLETSIEIRDSPFGPHKILNFTYIEGK